MRLAFISILRRLLGPQFGFLATICVQIAFFSCTLYSNFSVFCGFHLFSRRHIVRIVAFLVRMDWMDMMDLEFKGELHLHLHFMLRLAQEQYGPLFV